MLFYRSFSGKKLSTLFALHFEDASRKTYQPNRVTFRQRLANLLIFGHTFVHTYCTRLWRVEEVSRKMKHRAYAKEQHQLWLIFCWEVFACVRTSIRTCTHKYARRRKEKKGKLGSKSMKWTNARRNGFQRKAPIGETLPWQNENSRKG